MEIEVVQEEEETEAEIRSLFRDEEEDEEWCMRCEHTPRLLMLSRLEERIRKLKEAEKAEGKEEEAQQDPELHGEDGHQKLKVPDQWDLPGQGNSAQNPGMLSGRSGAYYEIHQQSNPPCKAGPLAELIVEEGGQVQSRRPDATAITCTPGRSHVPPGDHILPRACPVPDLLS